MICPKCGQSNEQPSSECIKCGIIFSKWQARQQQADKIKQTPTTTSQPANIHIPKWLIAVVILCVAIAIPRYFLTDDEKTAQNQQADSATESSAAPARTAENLPLERVDDVLGEMNSLAGNYGITFTRADLRNFFEGGHTSNLEAGYLDTIEEQAGLASRERADLVSGEGKIISKDNFLIKEVKCLQNGEWVYSKRIPKTNNNISECWKCGGGSLEGLYSNCKDWIGYRWQPNMEKWSPYSEADEYNGYQYLISNKLYTDEVFEKDQARLEAALNGDLPDDPTKRKTRIRQIILQHYRSRVGHLGAIHRMEELGALLGY
jgi:hypothetical protein